MFVTPLVCGFSPGSGRSLFEGSTLLSGNTAWTPPALIWVAQHKHRLVSEEFGLMPPAPKPVTMVPQGLCFLDVDRKLGEDCLGLFAAQEIPPTVFLGTLCGTWIVGGKHVGVSDYADAFSLQGVMDDLLLDAMPGGTPEHFNGNLLNAINGVSSWDAHLANVRTALRMSQLPSGEPAVEAEVWTIQRIPVGGQILECYGDAWFEARHEEIEYRTPSHRCVSDEDK